MCLAKAKIQIQVSRAVEHPVQLAHVMDTHIFLKKISNNIRRENLVSLSYSFTCKFSVLVELEIGNVSFCGERKTSEQGDNENKQ